MSDVFIDTNILVYAVDAADPAKQAIARLVLSSNPDAVISTQVMLEWYNVVTRRMAVPLSTDEARRGLAKLALMDARSTRPTDVVAAAKLADVEQLSLWDAMVVAVAARAGCTKLYTEDLNAGQMIGGVEIVNPFV